MSDDPVDLSPLDPTLDAARFERRIAAITARAAPALAARRRAPTVTSQLAGWTRSVLALAAALALVSTSALLASEAARRKAEAPSARGGDVTLAAVEWAMRGEAPTPGELLETFGGARDDNADQ